MQAASPTDGLNLWLPLAANSPAVVQALARGGWLVRGGPGSGCASFMGRGQRTASSITEGHL